MGQTPAAGPRQLSDLDRARLFLRAVNSYTLAEAALHQRHKLKPALRSLVDRLLSQWERTAAQTAHAPPQEAMALLRRYMEPLDERMAQGQRDIEEHYSRGERVASLFLAWGLFYYFKTRALDLMEELAGRIPTEAGSREGQEEPAPARAAAPDAAALREFQMALGMGP